MRLLGDAADATTNEFVLILGAIGALVGTVIAALVGAVKVLAPFAERYLDRRKAERDADRAEKRAQMRSRIAAGEQDLSRIATDGFGINLGALDHLRRRTEADRCVLIRLHNCGGPVEPVRFTQSSAELESCSDDVEPIAHSWRNERVDLHYSQVVGSLLSDDAPDWIELIRAELPDTSVLRRLYARFSVARAVKWYVGGRANGHYLIALHFADDTHATPEMLDRMREAANVIRGQIERFEAAQGRLDDARKELEKV